MSIHVEAYGGLTWRTWGLMLELDLSSLGPALTVRLGPLWAAVEVWRE